MLLLDLHNNLTLIKEFITGYQTTFYEENQVFNTSYCYTFVTQHKLFKINIHIACCNA